LSASNPRDWIGIDEQSTYSAALNARGRDSFPRCGGAGEGNETCVARSALDRDIHRPGVTHSDAGITVPGMSLMK
jgi:hypothetical protein